VQPFERQKDKGLNEETGEKAAWEIQTLRISTPFPELFQQGNLIKN